MPDDDAMAPITTVTLCGYPAASRVWAFNQMGSARRALGQVEGLRFWKLLGTGHGRGFSLRPDFSRYGLLAVWEHRAAANIGAVITLEQPHLLGVETLLGASVVCTFHPGE